MENNDAFFDERESTQTANKRYDRAELGKVEPAMQAAITDVQTDVAVGKQLIHAQEADTRHSSATSADSASRSITVNIELPAGLYSQGRYTGPDSLTINVKMPAMAE